MKKKCVYCIDLRVETYLILNTMVSRLDLRGDDRRLGHLWIFENSMWVTYQKAQKWHFLTFLEVFGEQFSCGVGGATEIDQFCLKNGSLFKIFYAEKFVTYRFWSTPLSAGHPQVEPCMVYNVPHCFKTLNMRHLV